jgi:hypothetical protein
MNATFHAVPWDQFPWGCFWYLLVMGCLHIPFFVVGSFVLALLPRKLPNTLTRRIVRFGLFVGLLLVVGSLFCGLWTCLVFNRLYFEPDPVVGFVPFWPITQGVIDETFGNEHGKLLGVTLTQLQMVWFLFALGTWGVTVLFYLLADRSLGRVESRRIMAARILALVMFPSSMLLAAGVWNLIAPDWLYHYRYGSPPISNFIPPFLHPRNDVVTTGMLRGYYIWPEWSVYVIWLGFIAVGLAVPAFILWRIVRDGREVKQSLPIIRQPKVLVTIVLGVLLLAVGDYWFIAASRSSAAPCVARLIVLDGCKQYWAQVNEKTTNDTPTWDDIRPYLPNEWTNIFWTNGIPVFPEGGTYTLGRVGVPPTYSIGESRHSMP